jgi:hypothetical protein
MTQVAGGPSEAEYTKVFRGIDFDGDTFEHQTIQAFKASDGGAGDVPADEIENLEGQAAGWKWGDSDIANSKGFVMTKDNVACAVDGSAFLYASNSHSTKLQNKASSIGTVAKLDETVRSSLARVQPPR